MLRDEILYPWRRRLAEHRAVAFEPGQKGDDLVELGKHETGEPTECDKENDGIDVIGEAADHDEHDTEHRRARQADECEASHPGVQFESAALARPIEMKNVTAIECQCAKGKQGGRRQDGSE